MITIDQFAQSYAERSGVTVEWLAAHGMEPMPCDCESADCVGFQMVHVKELLWAQKKGILLPKERELLAWRAEHL